MRTKKTENGADAIGHPRIIAKLTGEEKEVPALLLETDPKKPWEPYLVWVINEHRVSRATHAQLMGPPKQP